MKPKLKKSFSYFILGLLGFSTACHQTLVMYGTPPPIDTRVSGKVTDVDGNPIQGIQVGGYNRTVLTSADGSYEISGESFQTIRLIFTDIDGPDNGGEFAGQSFTGTFTEADRTGDRSFERTGIDVTMQPEEADAE